MLQLPTTSADCQCLQALVRTPLTERVYLEVFRSISTNHGVSVVTGDAGSGKSETIREFAELELGYWAVVCPIILGAAGSYSMTCNCYKFSIGFSVSLFHNSLFVFTLNLIICCRDDCYDGAYHL